MPYVIPYIAYAAAAISASVSVYSAVDQAKTAKETAKYNDQAFQAEAANKEALAAEAERRQREQNRRKISLLKNNLAAGGTLSSEGTPLAIIGESSANLELGIQDLARSASMQSNSLLAQGQMGLWEGDQMASASYLRAGASAVGGISSAAGVYTSGVKDGTFNDTYGLYQTRKTP